jgi:HAD superfamily hydrolase (TIGR01509 family)
MTRVILFDLSETIIAGLVGIEKPLALRLGMDEQRILPAFGGELLCRLCRGELTEDQYLALILEQQGWEIPAAELKQVIRRNFHTPVPGMWELLRRLSGRYDLALLSDHVREWVEYIQGAHPGLAVFRRQFYSFELGQLKSEPAVFQQVLSALDCTAAECLFVDDNLVNLDAAENAGVKGVRFLSADGLKEELAEWGIKI